MKWMQHNLQYNIMKTVHYKQQCNIVKIIQHNRRFNITIMRAQYHGMPHHDGYATPHHVGYVTMVQAKSTVMAIQ